jgi:adenylate cyclase
VDVVTPPLGLGDALVEWAHPGQSGVPGASLWRTGRVVLTAAIVLTNLAGTAAVLLITFFVLPTPAISNLPHLRAIDAVVALGYIVLAFPAGVLLGTRRLVRLGQWLRDDRAARPEEQRLVLRAPLRLFTVQVVLWLVAAALFGLLTATVASGPAPGRFGTTIGLTIAITGLVTAACAYLFAERILRSLAARALVDDIPARLAVPGVATRAVLAWALGTGLLLLGLVAIGTEALAGVPGTGAALGRVVVVLGGVGLVVGLMAVTTAARATADPLDALRRALLEVEQGRLDTQVPVYDGTQIGKLQIGFNQMARGLADRQRLRDAFGTYIDPDLAERILRDDTSLDGDEVEVTLMFIDVRDFTSFAEHTPAPEVVAALNQLFEGIVPIIHAHGGHVDKFIGDGLLAVFGTPGRQPDHADRALATALGIDRAVRQGRAGGLAIGIGLNSGVVVAGNVGGGGRLEFSVIGDPVNVAARVEGATRQTGDTILLAERTKELLQQETGATFVERVGLALKGKREPVRLFAPSLPAGE